jgi:hypothetical protein
MQVHTPNFVIGGGGVWLTWGIYIIYPYLQHTTQLSTPPAGFEPVIPASEQVQFPCLRPLGNWERPTELSRPT